ncbi:hypothetical protein D0C28_24520 [Rhizobium sp. AU243]|nr:hypothetical protein D0C28_24520 [Rhizobium sp. AU243]
MYITAVATPRNEAERKLLSEQHNLERKYFQGTQDGKSTSIAGMKESFQLSSADIRLPPQEKIM